jgi:anti-sigma regulatory factor (Ser/Thr protein kinase)
VNKERDLLAPNGRGIIIMRNYMDSLKLESTPQGSVIRMSKKLS